MTGTSKSSATTMTPLYKAGSGWDYDDISLTYDGEFDGQGRRVLYDSVGEAITMSGQTKSAATSLTALTKNNA